MNAGYRGKELADFAREWIEEGSTHDERRILANRVVGMLTKQGWLDAPKAVETPKPKPMSDSQAKAFAEERMSFGMFAGDPIKDVPRWYLCLLVDPTEWKTRLSTYLDSHLGKIHK